MRGRLQGELDAKSQNSAGKSVSAVHTDIFDVITYILGERYGIEHKENRREEGKWN